MLEIPKFHKIHLCGSQFIAMELILYLQERRFLELQTYSKIYQLSWME